MLFCYIHTLLSSQMVIRVFIQEVLETDTRYQILKLALSLTKLSSFPIPPHSLKKKIVAPLHQEEVVKSRHPDPLGFGVWLWLFYKL